MSAVRSAQEWKKNAEKLSIRHQAFIAGKYVAAKSGKTFDRINPATGQSLAKIAECDAADVDVAVKAARAAFDKGVWRHETPAKRKKVMLRFAELINQHRDELALLETLDMGKPINDSYNIDIPGSAACIAWYAETIDKMYDEVAPTPNNALALITREPMGVVGAVIPWNFPLMMAAWKLGPALATGNSVIVKPAEQSPLTALRVAELAAEAGLPEGVLNVVPGYGPTAGKAIGLHPDIDCVAFTGSGEVGKLFLQYSGQSNMKRVWLECGGKTPNIVLSDCGDLDKAATAAAFGIFFNQGEVCNAGSRLIVDAKIKDRLLEKIFKVGETLQPGDPLDPATKMGAIVDKTQLERVMGYIKKGTDEGADLVFGGKQVRENTGGYYVQPTVFDKVKNDMTIAREEIFGPVLSTITAKDDEDAIRIGNETNYGLAAAVWTRDISKAHKAARALRAGVVWVNCFDAGNIATPFGGFKQSGIGRDKSLHSLDKYVELKTTWIEL
ncbi:MAG: aldehyde dehydrogenase [Alphaproteobacteria bacterium]|nr:aldehyde dehydrogenase [Alphaproteobacteria bacterium]